MRRTCHAAIAAAVAVVVGAGTALAGAPSGAFARGAQQPVPATTAPATSTTASPPVATAGHGSIPLTPAFASSHFVATSTCSRAVKPGHVRCYAQRLVTKPGLTMSARAAAMKPRMPYGLSPADVQSAYQLKGLRSYSTVAIIDAYGYPNAERDLATYRAQFGLPACTRANGCLRIVNQRGATAPLPPMDLGWAQEQALDLDAVSASCPTCRILLVQADSSSLNDLGTAVNYAARVKGVKAISNSYGGDDIPDAWAGSYYNHPGIAITASSGDDGFQGASFPASSRYVTAVGGTSLYRAANARGWNETVWIGSGSGCSTSNNLVSMFASKLLGCSGRQMNDVAALANPNTGIALLAPTSASSSAWMVGGGTSLAAPIIASVYALSGNTAGYANAIPYAHPKNLWDITLNYNGRCGLPCWARPGYDGPSGLGSPHGVAGF